MNKLNVEDIINILNKKNVILIRDCFSNEFIDELKNVLKIQDNFEFYNIEGNRVVTQKDFYREAEASIPLLEFLGSNLDAFRDLLYSVDSKSYIVWDDVAVLYKTDKKFFYDVLDIMLGTSKELEFGYKASPNGDNNFLNGWEKRILRCLIIGNKQMLVDNYNFGKLHNEDFWGTLFEDLDSNTVVIE